MTDNLFIGIAYLIFCLIVIILVYVFVESDGKFITRWKESRLRKKLLKVPGGYEESSVRAWWNKHVEAGTTFYAPDGLVENFWLANEWSIHDNNFVPEVADCDGHRRTLTHYEFYKLITYYRYV